MKILVVGGGGREHAIVHALSKDTRIKELYCAPGNAGISQHAICVPIGATDIGELTQFAKDEAFDLVVVASDDPLALGLIDELENIGIRAFGPNKNAALIESSKSFAKNLMKKYGIPTADYSVFSSIKPALTYIRKRKPPIVIKADGLALGKGVIIAHDITSAEDALHSMMKLHMFGSSGDTVVIEDFMTGPEVTVMCFTDGKTISPMPSSQDHKRVFDGNRGPNTGGMGAFSPSPNYTPEIADYCMENIYKPTLAAMNAEGRKFKGVLYFGLMLTPDGPKVVEYNARFGDPEAQTVLPRLVTPLLDVINAVIDERLSEQPVEWSDGASCCVVMCSGGYPVMFDTGYEISGLNKLPSDIFVYHSGTATDSDGKYVTAGGRVLGVTANGTNLEEAIANSYSGVAMIVFPTMHFRTDIGQV